MSSISTERYGLARSLRRDAQAFSLGVPQAEALRIRDEVGLFLAVRAVLAKSVAGERKTGEELEHAIR